MALKARDEGLTGVVGQVLNFPVTCHPKFFPHDKYELASYHQNYNASIVTALRMEWFWDCYLPKPTPHPYHSPLLADSLKGLAPVCTYYLSFCACAQSSKVLKATYWNVTVG
jgi:acetyl esterase/lipase